MNNKLRHLGILFFDILSIGVLWIGYDNIKQTLMEINNQVDILRIGNRDGFFIVGIVPPFLHLINISGYAWPDFMNKYQKSLNYCVIGLLVASLAVGFAGSYWLKARAENDGYVHCWYVSGVSALAKSLVYAKDIKTCQELEAEARAKLK
jgi:hypothetical protein